MSNISRDLENKFKAECEAAVQKYIQLATLADIPTSDIVVALSMNAVNAATTVCGFCTLGDMSVEKSEELLIEAIKINNRIRIPELEKAVSKVKKPLSE